MDTVDLSELFNTRPQSIDFSSRLTVVIKQIFAKEFNPEKVLLEQFGIEKKDAIMTLLRNNNVNPQSRLDIKAFLEKIQEKINSMQVISLILAFEPREETLQGLSQWFLINMNRQVLFDIKVDKTLIGGAAILSGGKYLDYSIRPNFMKAFDLTFPKPKPIAVEKV
jgi:F0F1-type ATP synthase delta subunit